MTNTTRLLIAGAALALAALPLAAQQRVDLVVRGDWVVTMVEGEAPIRDGAIAIDDGVIVAVGPRATIESTYSATGTIDGTDRVLMPGLVNGHTHAAMVLFRGLADDLPLMRWLQEYIFPMEGRFVDEDFVRVGMRLACWEMIRGGTTTFVDMYFHPDVAAQVVDECGLRAVLAAPMIDFPSPGFEGWDDSFAAGVAFARDWRGRNARITPALGPHAPYTVSPEHLAQAAARARELGVPVSMHLAEDFSETTIIQERYHTTPVRHAQSTGILDAPTTIAAHVVWPDSAEMRILAASHAGAIHNPTSNLKTGAGVSPVPAMLAAGVRVGLGTDGAASNNDLDMWEEIRLAALLHKGIARDASVMPAATVLCLATRCGAEAIGMEDVIGSLRPGLRADVIQVSLESPQFAPMYDVVSHLVYVADAQDVVTTIVAGRVLMRGGRVLSVDGELAAADAARVADAIRAALESR